MSWTAGQFTRWLDAKEAKRQAGRPGNRNGPQSMVLAGETKWRPNTGAGSTAHSQALSGRLAASPSLEARRLPTSQKTNSSPSGARNLLTAPLGYMFCSAPHHISPQGSLEGNVSTSSSLGQGEKQSLRTSCPHAHPQKAVSCSLAQPAPTPASLTPLSCRQDLAPVGLDALICKMSLPALPSPVMVGIK